MWWLGIAAVLAGCGRIGFDVGERDANDSNNVVDDDAGVDAAPLGPFGTPVLVDLGGQAEDPTLTSDLLELYFSSSRAGGAGSEDLWFVTRASTSAPWSAAVQVPGLNSADFEGMPELGRDGVTLWFASDRTGSTGGYDVWMTTRASRGSAWAAPSRVAELSSAQNDYPSSVDASDRVFLIQTDRAGSQGNDIYIATRATTAAMWSSPQPLLEINSAASELNAALSADALTLMVAPDRPGGQGSYDIYESTRASLADAWSAPLVVAELCTSFDDGDPWLSDDHRAIYLSSTRGSTQTIYKAAR